MFNILTMELQFEQDVVAVRQRARQIARLLGLDMQVQTRLATAVSEIARNAYRYASGGKALFALDSSQPQHFWIRIQDRGPGIVNLQRILDGQYQSKTGMGLGIIGAQRLMECFEIETSAEHGTTVSLGTGLGVNVQALGLKEIAAIVATLAREVPQDHLSELRQQNIELMQALALLEKRELELSLLNKELADTNRGVIALNAELEDNASAVKRASEIKSHFLTLITHEFRTPVNSILSLSRVLMTPSERDPVSSERLKQVGFIRKAAESLSDLVNDILDTAKAEAGRLEIRPKTVAVTELFGALRAMFRSIITIEKPLDLVFHEPEDCPQLYTDEGKLAQIIRNFISNALKFTDHGSVEVAAKMLENNWINFSVTDTGIGIKESDQGRVFEDFTQIDSPQQRQAKGTGLGLPLARRLATLLGGHVSLQSTPGVGSCFQVTLPITLPVAAPEALVPAEKVKSESSSPMSHTILVIDDTDASRYVTVNLLTHLGYTPIEASNGPEGIEKARSSRPQAIFLDMRMPSMSGFEVLEVLKADPTTCAIPVIINSSERLGSEDFAPPRHAPAAILSKDALTCENATQNIRNVLYKAGLPGTWENFHESF